MLNFTHLLGSVFNFSSKNLYFHGYQLKKNSREYLQKFTRFSNLILSFFLKTGINFYRTNRLRLQQRLMDRKRMLVMLLV